MGWEWNDFAERLGLRCLFSDLFPWLSAYYYDGVIYLRRGMDTFETAWWAWHEIAHVLLHPGNIFAPAGRQLQEKQERQADEFAALFPVWDAPDVTFCATPVRIVDWDWESERRYRNCLWGGGV